MDNLLGTELYHRERDDSKTMFYPYFGDKLTYNLKPIKNLWEIEGKKISGRGEREKREREKNKRVIEDAFEYLSP